MDYTLPTMYCPNCGASLETSKRFCRKCGAQNLISIADIASSQASLPGTAALPISASDEKEVFEIHPASYSLIAAYVLAFLFSLLSTIFLAYFGASLKAALFSTAFFFLFPLRQHLRLNSTKYTLTTTKIQLEHGVFRKTQRQIPVQNIQDVTVHTSLFQRLLSLGDVIIDSASVAGKIQMTNVRQPRQLADKILAQLPRLKF